MKTNLWRSRALLVGSLVSAWLVTVFLFTDRTAASASLNGAIAAIHGTSVAPFCVLLLGVCLFRKLYGSGSGREKRFSFWGALVFSLCVYFGYSVSHWDSLLRPERSPFTVALDLQCLLGSFLLFYGMLRCLFSWLSGHKISRKTSAVADRWLGDNLRSFFLSFGILLTVYTAALLFYYPGMVTPDSNMQIAEGIGFYPLSDHHPYVHTLILALLLNLGRWLSGSLAGGIALFTFVQAALIAAVVSHTLRYMARRGIRPGFRILTLLFFALHPVVIAFSVSIWKDIWLSYLILLYTLCLLELVEHPESFLASVRNCVLLGAVIAGVLFSKNTGLITVALTLPFAFLFAGKYRRRLGLVALACGVLLGISRLILIPALEIVPGKAGEPLSAPLQQIARTVAREGDSLTEDQKNTISEILPLEQLPELYDPILSDPVKGSLDAAAFSEQPMRYLKLWWDLGRAHPRTYAESMLANSYGYWYPEVQYTQLDEDSYFTGPLADGSWGYTDPRAEDYTFRGASPRLRHLAVYLFDTVRSLPGGTVLFSVALYFWAAFLLGLIACFRRKYRMLLPLGVSLTIFLVCILSPVMAECRYAFPALVILPLLTAFILQEDLPDPAS